MREITVVIPAYNAADYLPRCLESLLIQKRPIEIIVVNDGSTDETGRIAAEYAARHDNVIAVNQENAGSGMARKAGLALVRTPYVGFVDSDDWVEADMYGMLHDALVTSGADVACCGLTLDWPNRSEKLTQSHETGSVLNAEEAMRSLHRREDVFQYMNNKIYKRELFDGVLIRSKNFIGEDYAVMTQVLDKVDRIVIVNEGFYHYVQTSVSVSRSGYKPQHELAYRIYKEEEKALIEKYPALKDEICNYLMTEYLAFLAAMGRGNVYDHEIARDIMRFARRNLVNYLRAPYVEARFKASALAAAVHYRVMTALYRAVVERV